MKRTEGREERKSVRTWSEAPLAVAYNSVSVASGLGRIFPAACGRRVHSWATPAPGSGAAVMLTARREVECPLLLAPGKEGKTWYPAFRGSVEFTSEPSGPGGFFFAMLLIIDLETLALRSSKSPLGRFGGGHLLRSGSLKLPNLQVWSCSQDPFLS